MSDLTIALSVTTPDLDDIDGPYTAADGFAEVVAYDPGSMGRRRQVLRSPTVTGHRQVSSVADSRLLVVTLRIFGTTKALLDSHAQTWFDVFSQTNYHTTISVDGVDTEWACDDADWQLVGSENGGVDKFRLMAAPRRQIYEFRIPTQPFPTVGVI